MTDLEKKHCIPCEGGVAPLTPEEIQKYHPKIEKWEVVDNQKITRKFDFHNFYKTMAFVNALAFMAHREDHHPDLQLGYNYCTVTYFTHAINGLSENDIICAMKVDKLIMS